MAIKEEQLFVRMYYNGYGLMPVPQMSYSTELFYMNDVPAGHIYKITLNGKLLASDFVGGIPDALTYLNNLFAANGHLLELDEYSSYGGMAPIFLANNIIVRNIQFKESPNNWVKYIDYSVELESTDVLFGKNLSAYYESMAAGNSDPLPNTNTQSPFMNNGELYDIKSWDEQFSITTGDTSLQSTQISVRQLDYENDEAPQGVPITFTADLGGEYLSISYSVNAVGHQRFKKYRYGGEKLTLPAWEHAKRFVHAKLIQQMGGLFQNFLSQNGPVYREFIGANWSNGAFATLADNHSQGITGLPSYSLYNENISFDVSESDGSFSATYNAIVKKHCSTDYNGAINEEYAAYCSDAALHTVTKTVDKSYEANQYPTVANIKYTITLNGEITGLVPGGILNPQQKFVINQFPTGSFLAYNTTSVHPQTGQYGGRDRWWYASVAFDKIFDYNKYDLKTGFKQVLGITPYAIGVSPTANVTPHSFGITRNMLEGKITYTATYGTKLNCDPNNFEITVSTNESIPVIAEFTVPNNNTVSTNGVICDTGRGYGVVQLLGTQTPKTIDIGISASVIQNWNKCCFGSVANDGSDPAPGALNLLNWDFMQLNEFILPSGMNIPYISEKYALTKRTKSVKYPQGDMSVNLSYVCADICEIKDFFSEDPDSN